MHHLFLKVPALGVGDVLGGLVSVAHGVANGQTWLRDWIELNLYCLEIWLNTSWSGDNWLSFYKALQWLDFYRNCLRWIFTDWRSGCKYVKTFLQCKGLWKVHSRSWRNNGQTWQHKHCCTVCLLCITLFSQGIFISEFCGEVGFEKSGFAFLKG